MRYNGIRVQLAIINFSKAPHYDEEIHLLDAKTGQIIRRIAKSIKGYPDRFIVLSQDSTDFILTTLCEYGVIKEIIGEVTIEGYPICIINRGMFRGVGTLYYKEGCYNRSITLNALSSFRSLPICIGQKQYVGKKFDKNTGDLRFVFKDETGEFNLSISDSQPARPLKNGLRVWCKTSVLNNKRISDILTSCKVTFISYNDDTFTIQFVAKNREVINFTIYK